MNILEYRRKALGYTYREGGDYEGYYKDSDAAAKEAVRQMYLTQVGREPDAGGLAYFAERFGTEVSPAELQTFRDMAAAEIAAVEAQRAAAPVTTTAPAASTAATTTTTAPAATTTTTAATTAGSAESVATPAAAAPAATTQSIREKIAASLGVPVGSVDTRYGTKIIAGRDSDIEVQDTSKVLGYAVKNNDELGSLFDPAGNTTGYYIPKNPSSMGEHFLDSLEDVSKVALVAAAGYYGIPWLINAGAAAAGAGATVTATAGAAASGFTVSGFLAAPGLTIGTALGITNPIAAALAGNIIIQTATNGGDVEKAIKGAVLSAGLSYAGNAVSGALNTALKDINLPDIVKTGIVNGATALVTAKATGQNPLDALVGSALSTAIGGVVKSMPSIGNIPKEARSLATAAITAALTGKDITNATLNAALAEGKKAAAGYIDVATGLSPDVKAIAEAYKDPSRALDVVQPAADTVTATQQAIDDQVAAALDSSSTDPAEAAAIFKAVYGRDPAAGELADYMGTSEADVTALLGQQFLDLTKITNAGLTNGVVTAGVNTGTVTDAGTGSSPLNVDVSGFPIYADNPEAASLTLPTGYRVASVAEIEADNRPSGAYYDEELNAWLTPAEDTVADYIGGTGSDSITGGTKDTDSITGGTTQDDIESTLAANGLTTVTGGTKDTDSITGSTTQDDIESTLAANGLTTVTGGTGSDSITGGTDDIESTLASLGTGINTGTGTTTQDNIDATLADLGTGINTTYVDSSSDVVGNGSVTGTGGTGGTDCAEGFHEDPVTGLCVPDDDEEKDTTCPDGYVYNSITQECEKVVEEEEEEECAEGFHKVDGLCVPDDDEEGCAEGFHEDPVTGLCVPDDDEVIEECPLGEVRNLDTGLCEKVTDTTVITKPIVTTPVVTTPVVTTPVVTTPVVTTPVVTTPVVTKPVVTKPVVTTPDLGLLPSSVESQTTTKPGPLVAPREGAASEGDPLDNLLKLLARYKTGQNEGSGYGGVSASGFEMAEGGLLDSQDDSYSTGDPYLDELLATLR